MKGYNFGDNKMNVHMGPDDGFLQKDFPGFLPKALTLCSRFYAMYTRHGDQWGLWNIFLPWDKDKRKPVFNVLGNAVGNLYTDVHGVIMAYGKISDAGYPKHNLLRKWNHVCVVLDFINNDITCAINGEVFNRTHYEEDRKESGSPLQRRLPKGYYEGKSNNTSVFQQ